MAGPIAVNSRFKEGFFDRDKVLKAIGRARVRIFNEFGRKVRARAQKSIRYADGPAAIGTPPHAHKSRTILRRSRRTGQVLVSKRTGGARKRSVSFLREFIEYKYDFTTGSVVIGPARLDSTVDPAALPALEYGGTATILDHGTRKKVAIGARPFMHPAFDAERAGLSGLWRDSVR